MLGTGRDKIEGNQPINSVQAASNVINGDCVQVLSQVSSESVDFVLTDPPYISKYVSRDGHECVPYRPTFFARVRCASPRHATAVLRHQKIDLPLIP